MKILPFSQAREFARTLGLTSYREWIEYCKSSTKHIGIPKRPEKVYRHRGWVSMQDFLGHNKTQAYSQRDYLPYEQALKFVHSLGIKEHKQWLVYCKSGDKPHNIPYHPHVTYASEGWVSFYEWFGKELPQYLDFTEARNYVHSLNIKTSAEWYAYCKSGKPSRIPSKPSEVYKGNGWVSFYDWLGTKPHNKREFVSYDEAQSFIRLLGFEGVKDWKAWCAAGKKPDHIPSAPNVVYKGKGWVSFAAWFGCEKERQKYIQHTKKG